MAVITNTYVGKLTIPLKRGDEQTTRTISFESPKLSGTDFTAQMAALYAWFTTNPDFIQPTGWRDFTDDDDDDGGNVWQIDTSQNILFETVSTATTTYDIART